MRQSPSVDWFVAAQTPRKMVKTCCKIYQEVWKLRERRVPLDLPVIIISMSCSESWWSMTSLINHIWYIISIKRITLSPNQAEWARMKNIERYYSFHECRSNLFRLLSECSSNPLRLSFDILSSLNAPRLFWTCSKHSGWLQEWDRMSRMHSECNTNVTNAFRIDPNVLRLFHSNGIRLIRPLVWLGFKGIELQILSKKWYLDSKCKITIYAFCNMN